jgi:GT2 family glycosyltransferase
VSGEKPARQRSHGKANERAVHHLPVVPCGSRKDGTRIRGAAETGSMNGLSVIIPSKNAKNLVSCVEAVREHESFVNIIVIDDGLDSDPKHVARLDALRERDADFYCGVKPFVFARNINLGIDAAGDYDVIILNDDALLQSPGGFLLLHAYANEHPEYGLIAASCNNVGNTNQWRNLGNKGVRDEQRMVCFVCVLIPRKTIEQVGLLDERFVHYGCEDDDYSLRVRKAGLKLGIHDGCYVDHGSLSSSFRGKAGTGGNYLPNLKLFIEKWGVDNWGKSRAHSQFSDLFPA